MSSNITNRLGLTLYNIKSLKSNGYSKGRFQTVTSGFGNYNKKYKKKKNLTNYSDFYNWNDDDSIIIE